MSRRTDVFVSGVVLAAGGGKRAGAPARRDGPVDERLLARVVETARACRFDQLLVAAGAATAALAGVNLAGADVVANDLMPEGYSSSIAAALAQVDPRTNVLVLLLGDQPGVVPAIVQSLLDGLGIASVAVCRYEDGRGHPLAFGREVFGDLEELEDDNGVWKLLEQRADDVVDVPMPGAMPRELDTWADYEVLAAETP